METRYNVYFAGQLLEGQELSRVRDGLGKLFNADEQTLDKLFSGKAQLLKRDCDKATALKYKQAMERAGALPVIKQVQAASTQPTATAAPVPGKTLSAAEKIAALAAAPDEAGYRSEHAAASTDSEQGQQSSEQAGINLAPAGTEVLRENERQEPLTRDIDTSGLEVDAAAQRLSEEPPPHAPTPDTSHLDMGAVGELIPTLPSDEQPLSPDTDAIDLAPEGTDFSDCAAPAAESPALDLSGMDLAPTGSDVLEDKYRHKQAPPAPSTEHISLEE